MIDPEVLKIIEHFANIEKCVICKKIITSEVHTINNNTYCHNCFITYKSPKCFICNKIITGYHYTFSVGYCCESCYEQNPRCFHCGLPANKYSPYIYKDEDFMLCQKCNKNKITRKVDLRKLHFKMKSCAKEALGIYIPIKKVMLLPSSEFNKRKNDKYPKDNRVIGLCKPNIKLSSNFSSNPNCFFEVNNEIYLQSGMPYDMMFETLAHEYGHAWEHQNKSSNLLYLQDNIVFSEGFAQWVAYHTLRQYNLKEQANKIITKFQDDPIYGLGFKEMLKLEKKLGSKQAVLEYVKNNNDF